MKPKSKVRGQKYFPQLKGLGDKLNNIIQNTPRSTAINASNNIMREDSDIQERLDKQAAKLARRAKRAGYV